MTQLGSAPVTVSAWLEGHTRRAPEPLRARVRVYAAAAAADAEPGASGAAEALARAGRAALAQVLAHPGDRSVALDLLAADALVTLALLAQAKLAPERLRGFADALLREGAAAS
jgi:hypothetical protein